MDRHTKSSPCPICGGAVSDKQGKGKRCWGFTSEGAEWVHCTREDLAGSIQLNEKSSAYPHKIGGSCQCGTEHAPYRGNGNGHVTTTAKRTATYVYKIVDERGKLHAKHVRVEYADGNKEMFFTPKGIKSYELPLYGLLDLLKAEKGSSVVVTEGEKKCDALKRAGILAVGTCCGSPGAPWKASLKPLMDYKVYLWADNDEPGRASMAKIAATLKEFGKECLEIKWDQAPAKGDAADFLDEGKNGDDVKALMVEAKLFGLTEWEEPIKFEDLERPDFPVGALPGWLAAWVNGIAVETQTPTDLAAMLGLSVLAASAAKKYRIQIRESWSEPLNLMVAVALPPGERKSAVFAEAIKPIQRFEYEHAKAWSVEYQQKKVEYEIAEDRMLAVRKEATKTDTPDMAKINAAVAVFAALKKPVMPRVYADDVTPEKLGEMLANQNGKLAIFSAEGGIFTVMEGRYADSMPSFDTILKAHSGDSIRVDRLSREANIINSPSLTLGLAVQPGVLQDLGKKKEFLSRGLLARFLYSVPKSKVGDRSVTPFSIELDTKDRYIGRMKRLLERPEKIDEYGEIDPVFVKMSPGALELFLDYAKNLEPRLGPDGDLPQLGGWGSKLMGAIARVAGLLHLAEHAVTPLEAQTFTVNEQEMIGAIAIGDYLMCHVKAAFGIIGSDSNEEAIKILGWIKKERLQSFSKRDIWRAFHGHVKKAGDLDAPIKTLEEMGYIRCVEQKQKRGRPSEKFNVYPAF